MKKLSKIEEGLFTSTIKRGYTDEKRKEDGLKVHTCLGIDVFLKNPNLEFDGLDYNGIIKEIIDGEFPSPLYIDKLQYITSSTEEKANVRSGKALYTHLIYEGRHGDDLCVSFSTHSELQEDWDNLDFSNFDEYDYISICKCVATKLSEIGEYLEYIPNDYHTIDKEKNRDYKREYHLCLIDESSVSDWEYENEIDYDWSKDFQKLIIEEFPELEKEDFMLWSYQNGANIAIPINFNNVLNFEKYKKFTEDFFKV